MGNLSENEVRNLDAIFTYARQAVVNNEQELMNVIVFKGELYKKLGIIAAPAPAPEEKKQPETNKNQKKNGRK